MATVAEPISDKEVVRPAAQDASGYTVDGTISSIDRPEVGKLRLEIVDKNIGADVHVADASTGDGGKYQATFQVADLDKRGKQKPDLQVRVFAGETVLATTEVRYSASTHETIDVVLPAPASAALPSEYETLIGALADHYKGSLGDLKESDDRQDITYLANKTGWDARTIAFAALADQFSKNSGEPAIPPIFFYALFRAGLPTTEDTLYQVDSGTAEAAWKKAVDQGVIPKSSANDIPKLLQQFQSISAQRLATGPALEGASSFKEMLAVSGVKDAKQQQRLAELYVSHRNDTKGFWDAVKGEFKDAAPRLQIDGKLSFVTKNNAPLMQALHMLAGGKGITDLVQLAQMGYHNPAKWAPLLANVLLPKEIPGGTPEEQRNNYAASLAAQVRQTYPTASVAEMLNGGTLQLTGVTPKVKDSVYAFLNEHQADFEIGLQPIEQYIARNKLTVPDQTVTQVKRLHRVLQITPNDQAMIGLMKQGIDSAYQIARYDKEVFVQALVKNKQVDEASAKQTYDKAVQVHNAVLNIAISYLTAKNGIPLGKQPLTPVPAGSDGTGQIMQPAPKVPAAANAGDVIPYATLESLFGSMDFCTCDECRSILSPAAYLVDLLRFVGRDDWAGFLDKWHSDHGGVQYPFRSQQEWKDHGSPTTNETEISPLDVLRSRRPDIMNLPLSCENTNTALPYIDIVNETLEYFIANNARKMSLNDYPGHDTAGVASEDLLASPQYVMDSAYGILRDEQFPAPLPFNQPLENLRRYFNKFDVSLPLAMERLRRSDVLDVDRTGSQPPPVTDYGWRDILIEDIKLSREEYQVLTDSKAVPLWRMYGLPEGTKDDAIINGNLLHQQMHQDTSLSNAKAFCRYVGITYEDIAAILKTKFVNPNSDVSSKLQSINATFGALTGSEQRFGVSSTFLKALREGKIKDGDFDALLPHGAGAIDVSEFGGSTTRWEANNCTFAPIIKDWLNRKDTSGADIYTKIMKLIVLTDPSDAPDPNSFDNVKLLHVDSTSLDAVEFVRLLRFIRLWKKLGWTIDQTDEAICALYKADLTPIGDKDLEALDQLDKGFQTHLPRLGIVVRVMNALSLTVDRDLQALLACWSDLGTHGVSSLYRRMFLSPAMLKQDAVFADNGYGEFLQRVALPYSPSQPNLPPQILAVAPSIGYDNSDKLLSYAGILDDKHRISLKALAVADAPFKIAVDGLYDAGRLLTHSEALRSAFNLTADEFIRITAALNYNATTQITLRYISEIFRRGWLARKLKISVRELLLLIQLTGLDPFAAPDIATQGAAPEGLNHPEPPILQLIALVQALKDRSLKTEAALYLMWNQDLSGKSAPTSTQITQLARGLRAGFADVDNQFSVKDDPAGSIARARMAVVYGNDAADFFFGLLNDTLLTSEPYDHWQPTLEQEILDAASNRISYDDFRKQLSYTGVLTADTRDAIIKSVPDGAGTDRQKTSFTDAVTALYNDNRKVIDPFFARYPDLEQLYDAYVFFVNLRTSVKFNQPADHLDKTILEVAPGKLSYDSAYGLLSFVGVLTSTTRDTLKAAAGATKGFQDAVDELYTENCAAIKDFFGANPKLENQDAYETADNSPTMQRALLLGTLLRELRRNRKRQEAIQTASDASQIPITFAKALLDTKTTITWFVLSARDRLSAVRTGSAVLVPGNIAGKTGSGLPPIPLRRSSDKYVLHAANDRAVSALDDFTKLEVEGLSAQFYYRASMPSLSSSPPPDVTSEAEPDLCYSAPGDLPPNAKDPNGTISGIWNGYLEAPENAFFNLRIEADTAAITLTLDGATVEMTAEGTNANPIELRAGVLYSIEIKAEGIKDKFIVSWETPGRGWEVIPQQYLYSATYVDRLRVSCTRFLKAATLATSLGLAPNEIVHLALHSDYWINSKGQVDSDPQKGEGWLNSLPTSDGLLLENATDRAAAQTLNATLLIPLRALLNYARIKSDISAKDESLLNVLEDPDAATANADSLLYSITRWDEASLTALRTQFGSSSVKDLIHLEVFRRIYDAFALIKEIGISASALIAAATNEPDATTVRNLQAALRARYDPADWRQVVRPINDQMRDLQRDALVAYILHQMYSNIDTAHINTPDKLFEYFIMDVEMEPSMQTSRIRHALSSVQLFVERCLMNLEPRVAPECFNPDQWAWMKRYRVWEANRKVFLFPENWLEPELREDQSPFFKETMSELLQSDITEDTAETALLNYLSKLDEVAKLEPCGICREEGEQGDYVDHVIARTAGAHRKYYYRRYENGYWTPWEQIKLDIEDNPVLPVVLKTDNGRRLLLFWLRIIKQGPDTAARPKNDYLTKLTTNDLPPDPNVTVKALLCWSEYYNGKWQPAKTSDQNPVLLEISPFGVFDRSRLELWAPSPARVQSGCVLWVCVGHRDEMGVPRGVFGLYNTHSLPVVYPGWGGPCALDQVPDVSDLFVDLLCFGTFHRMFNNCTANGFGISSYEIPWLQTDWNAVGWELATTPEQQPSTLTLLLNKATGAQAIGPRQPWDSPFFFEDGRHVFYVRHPDPTYVTLGPPENEIKPEIAYGVGHPIVRLPIEIPPLNVVNGLGTTVRPRFLLNEGTVNRSRISATAPIKRLVTSDAYIRQSVCNGVAYGNCTIGPLGSISKVPKIA